MHLIYIYMYMYIFMYIYICSRLTDRNATWDRRVTAFHQKYKNMSRDDPRPETVATMSCSARSIPRSILNQAHLESLLNQESGVITRPFYPLEERSASNQNYFQERAGSKAVAGVPSSPAPRQRYSPARVKPEEAASLERSISGPLCWIHT